MKISVVILVACLSVSLVACGTQAADKSRFADQLYTSVKINYLSDGNDYRNAKLTYKLMPMKDGEFDLHSLKTGKEIKKILKTAGMEESDSPDIVVFFDFRNGGVSSKEESIPYAITGQTGIASATTTGTRYGENIVARTTVIPTYGVVGYGEHKYTTYHDSYSLSLMAVDAAGIRKGEPRQLWVATLAAGGKLLDEQLNLRAMLMTVKDLIGRSRDKSSLRTLTKDEIVNPPPHMDLEVDGAGGGARAYLDGTISARDGTRPQPYSVDNGNQELIRKVGNWTVFCQKSGGTVSGCGMTDAGLTVFIEGKGYVGSILIGGQEGLGPETDACLALDGEVTCLKVRAASGRAAVRYVAFEGDLFWKLEKSGTVTAAYKNQENIAQVQNVDTDNYSAALAVLRRSLP